MMLKILMKSITQLVLIQYPVNMIKIKSQRQTEYIQTSISWAESDC